MYTPMWFGTSWHSAFFGAWWTLFLIPLMLWSLVWKGFALWRAARQGNTPWFVALLIINTLGILEILYLFVFSKPAGLERRK